jgi:hypothetical protein
VVTCKCQLQVLFRPLNWHGQTYCPTSSIRNTDTGIYMETNQQRQRVAQTCHPVLPVLEKLTLPNTKPRLVLLRQRLSSQKMKGVGHMHTWLSSSGATV